MSSSTSTSPFQWALTLSDSVSSPADDIISKIQSLTTTSEALSGVWRTLTGLAAGALGLYTLDQALTTTISLAKQLNSEWVSMANKFGSDLIGDKAIKWMDDIQSRIPILRDDLTSFIGVAARFGASLESINMEGLWSTSLVTGNDVASIAQSIAGYTQQMRMSYMEAVQASVELTGTTKAARNIMHAMNSTAWNSQQRFQALSNVVGNAFPDAAERMKESIDGLQKLISNKWQLIIKSMFGDGKLRGVVYEIKELFKSIHSFVERNFEVMKNIAAGAGMVFSEIFKFFRAVGDMVYSYIDPIFASMTKDTEGFMKGTVYPFITFLAIGRVMITKFIKNFTAGFADGFSDAFSIIGVAFDFFKGIVVSVLKTLRIIDDHTNIISISSKVLGYVLGWVAGMWLGYQVAVLAANTAHKAFLLLSLPVKIAIAKIGGALNILGGVWAKNGALIGKGLQQLFGTEAALTIAKYSNSAIGFFTRFSSLLISLTPGATSLSSAIGILGTMILDAGIAFMATFGWPLAIIAAIAGAIYLLYDNWDAIIKKFPVIGKMADTVKQSWLEVTKYFSDSYTEVVNKFKSVWLDVSNYASQAFQPIKESWRNLVKTFNEVIDPFREDISALWTLISTGANIAFAYMSAGWNTYIKPLAKFLKNILLVNITGVKIGFMVLGDVIGFAFKTAIAVVSNVINGIIKLVTSVIKLFKGDFKGAIKDFGSALATPFKIIKELVLLTKGLFSNIGKDIKSGIKSMLGIKSPPPEPVKTPTPVKVVKVAATVKPSTKPAVAPVKKAVQVAKKPVTTSTLPKRSTYNSNFIASTVKNDKPDPKKSTVPVVIKPKNPTNDPNAPFVNAAIGSNIKAFTKVNNVTKSISQSKDKAEQVITVVVNTNLDGKKLAQTINKVNLKESFR